MSNQRFLSWLEKSMFHYGEQKSGSGYSYKWSHLARDVGLRAATVSAWRKRGSQPDPESIHKLAVHFGITSREIYKAIGIEAPAGTDSLALREQLLSIFSRLDPRRQQKVLKGILAEYESQNQK